MFNNFVTGILKPAIGDMNACLPINRIANSYCITTFLRFDIQKINFEKVSYVSVPPLGTLDTLSYVLRLLTIRETEEH